MYFAHITDGSVDRVGTPPRKIGDVHLLLDLSLDTLASFDWFPVAEAPRPADTETVTYEVEVRADEAGLPVEVWVSRPWTALELAARSAETNEAELRSSARVALDRNATYLALGSPTNAQNAAQVKALTRQMNALIKLTLHDLADTSGT